MDITYNDSFISSGFDEPILYAPARTDIAHSCSILKIVTAFTDCDRISTHMIKLAEGIKSNNFIKNLKVEIILGMTKSSLSVKKHEDICRLACFGHPVRNKVLASDIQNISFRQQGYIILYAKKSGENLYRRQ